MLEGVSVVEIGDLQSPLTGPCMKAELPHMKWNTYDPPGELISDFTLIIVLHVLLAVGS